MIGMTGLVKLDEQQNIYVTINRGIERYNQSAYILDTEIPSRWVRRWIKLVINILQSIGYAFIKCLIVFINRYVVSFILHALSFLVIVFLFVIARVPSLESTKQFHLRLAGLKLACL